MICDITWMSLRTLFRLHLCQRHWSTCEFFFLLVTQVRSLCIWPANIPVRRHVQWDFIPIAAVKWARSPRTSFSLKPKLWLQWLLYSGGECETCPEQCTQCTSASTCSECKDGHKLSFRYLSDSTKFTSFFLRNWDQGWFVKQISV